MGIIIFALSLATLQAGSAIVNQEGCLRNWCKDKVSRLEQEARDVIVNKVYVCGAKNNINS